MKKLMMGVVAAMAMGVMAEAVNTVTQTTPVPVPYAWLDAHVPGVAQESEAYEAAAREPAANGRPVWACYAVGLDPSDPLDDFRITRFWMDGGMPMFEFNHRKPGLQVFCRRSRAAWVRIRRRRRRPAVGERAVLGVA